MVYFVIIRPQVNQEKQQHKLISSLKLGDEVICAGGIMGTIGAIYDEYFVVQVNPGNEITIQRKALSGILPQGTLKSLNAQAKKQPAKKTKKT
jgi:preprotein translocase subunit YajC